MIQQAYVEGVSTRRVDDLVKALGCEGISKSQVSRICQELDVVVDGFLGRPLDGGPYPYLWLDALTQKVREDGRIVNVSVVVATAVNGEGKREFIGMDVGTSEDGAFWLAFLRSLSARGLSGVELVVSDAHQGLRGAIAAVFGGASWQRCRTHFMTNLLTRVPRRAQPWVATMVRTIYQQPSPDEVHAQLDRVTSQLHDRFPEVASLLDEAGPDVLAFSSFPLAHWKKLWSNNPQERLNKEIRRRTDVVGIFPNRPPCAASLAPSWLSSTTNGSSDVDTSHPPFSPSTKLFRRPISRRRQPPKQQQHDDALLHHLTGRDPRSSEDRLHNFLWLFQRTDTFNSGSSGSRTVNVFKLERIENAEDGQSTVKLLYAAVTPNTVVTNGEPTSTPTPTPTSPSPRRSRLRH